MTISFVILCGALTYLLIVNLVHEITNKTHTQIYFCHFDIFRDYSDLPHI